jgi:hypothetical protein
MDKHDPPHSTRTLALKVDKSYQTIENWVTGDTKPNANDVPALADALGKTMLYFYVKPTEAPDA